MMHLERVLVVVVFVVVIEVVVVVVVVVVVMVVMVVVVVVVVVVFLDDVIVMVDNEMNNIYFKITDYRPQKPSPKFQTKNKYKKKKGEDKYHRSIDLYPESPFSTKR